MMTNRNKANQVLDPRLIEILENINECCFNIGKVYLPNYGDLNCTLDVIDGTEELRTFTNSIIEFRLIVNDYGENEWYRQ